VSVRDLYQVFGNTCELDRVSLDLRGEEVHGLCGGNRSGKSTLIKIFCEVAPRDSDTVRSGNRALTVHNLNPLVSHELGSRVGHQDLAGPFAHWFRGTSRDHAWS
jgi:ABC-type sugar transport system ATPase subunit